MQVMKGVGARIAADAEVRRKGEANGKQKVRDRSWDIQCPWSVPNLLLIHWRSPFLRHFRVRRNARPTPSSLADS